MQTTKMITGAALGIGTIAILPFTGKGSVLGSTTLGGSLSGWGTLLLAATAGAAGAYAGAHAADIENNLQRVQARAAAKNRKHIKLAS